MREPKRSEMPSRSSKQGWASEARWSSFRLRVRWRGIGYGRNSYDPFLVPVLPLVCCSAYFNGWLLTTGCVDLQIKQSMDGAQRRLNNLCRFNVRLNVRQQLVASIVRARDEALSG